MKIAALALGLTLAGGAVIAATVPKVVPGKLETYRDWTIGCDNVGRCEASSLLSEDNWPDHDYFVRIERDPGPTGDVVVWLQIDDDTLTGAATFTVDGRRIATAPLSKAGAKLGGPQAAALAVAMARGTKFEVRLGIRLLAAPSLSGLAAALRYIDAQQGRAGTTTAMMATGALGPQAVKAAPAFPVVKAMLPPAGVKPAALWAEERTRAVKMAGCTMENDPRQEIEIQALSRSQSLVLIPCGAGAYNYMSVPLVASGGVGRRAFVVAKFDYSGVDKDVTLVNAGWDPKTGQLETFDKGRGIGDCGNSETYVWDGVMFRLVAATAMNECRGARDWITVWRARVQP